MRWMQFACHTVQSEFLGFPDDSGCGNKYQQQRHQRVDWRKELQTDRLLLGSGLDHCSSMRRSITPRGPPNKGKRPASDMRPNVGELLRFCPASIEHRRWY